MKYPHIVSADALAACMDQGMSVLDVRSPSEFLLDHVPGAENFPVLDDAQRVTVGTLYKQQGPFEAKKIGAALVAANVAQHLQQSWQGHGRDWRPLVYCWRGGNRSGACAHILAKIGWPVHLLEGGYKAYRQYVAASLPGLAQGLELRIVCGMTGVGKSRLLQALAQAGAQVLDLEELACHRGSLLGHLPEQAQPSQKAFESALWEKMRRFDVTRVVYVEAESQKVGNLRVPESLIQRMRQAPCLFLQAALPLRVELLLQDYAHFTTAPDGLLQKLAFLTPLHGRATVQQWEQMVRLGQFAQVTQALLEQHYDPSYLRSMQRNFSLFHNAHSWELRDLQDFPRLAQEIIAAA
ncbi:tRNA 2-selenouridine(34) synthase MnmH [Massilia sp. W12]|uniref:tRNA 2-selenouridine(34) synthase MnmH n=1 Tax=Massilia sp. W12 TaxID=3126507 RepID=UPI0030D53C59